MPRGSDLVVVACLVLGLSVPAGASSAAGAADRQVPAGEQQIRLSFAPIVERVAPAVVNVYASRVVARSASPFMADPFFRHFFGGRDFGVPEQRVQRSLGSGVIIDPDGTIVTNHHVIANADEVRVALADRREFECDVILKDERTDLAVLRIRRPDGALPYVPFADSDELEVGDLVLAIGDPFGVGQTVTSGIVSALARTQVGISDYQFFIQTDAAINPGNSGGPLIDMTGRLVGINTAIYSRSGQSSGIGFAIPSNMVRVVVESARAGGHVRLPWIGARLQPVTPEIADALGLATPQGALVAEVAEGGPGARAGLASGDLIVSVDGMRIDDPSGLNYRLATKGVGSKASLGVMRNGKRYAATLDVEGAPETVPRSEVRIVGGSPLSGALAWNLSPAVAEELAYDGRPEGVIVAEVEPGSTAERAGFRRGDVVLAVNGIAVEDTRHLAAICGSSARFWQVAIERDGRVIQSRFRG